MGLFRETEEFGDDIAKHCGLVLFHNRDESHPIIDMALRLASEGKRFTHDDAKELFIVVCSFGMLVQCEVYLPKHLHLYRPLGWLIAPPIKGDAPLTESVHSFGSGEADETS